MTLLFATGFETTDNLSLIFDSVAGSIVSSPKRNGNYALRLGYNNGHARKNLSENKSTLIVGAAFNKNHARDEYIFRFSNSNLNSNVEVRVSTANHIYIKLRDSTSYFTDFYMNNNLWYYIEFKSYCHTSQGTVILKINGVEIFNLSGVNTAYSSGNPYHRIVMLYGNSSLNETTSYTYYDDFYICDNSGSKNNDFLGDIKVLSYYPTRNGSVINFTPVGASSNYDAVDETLQDGDTTYVTQSGEGLYDLYGFTAPSISGSLLAIQQSVTARKDDAGSRFIRMLNLYNNNSEESESISLLDTYRTYFKVYESRPGTSEDWSLGDLNSAEFGVKIVAS